jgi:MFS family permease
MMKSSTVDNRTLLFSINFALVTLSGTFGNFFAGQMPAFFGSLFGVPATSAEAYRIVLLIAVGLGSFTLIPLALIRTKRTGSQNQDEISEPEQQSLGFMMHSLRGTLSRSITYKLSLPNLLIGFGAAILIPYMNIYFRNQYNTSDQTLGIIFSLSSLLIGIGAFIGPRLALKMDSKIKAIVLTQWLSLVFLLILGFSPLYGLAAFAFLMRSALMNMSVPLYDAFSMEQVHEREQATVVSIKETAWQLGWTVGPYISGVVQETHGFDPLFITTAIMYGFAILLIWIFFRNSEKPRRQKPEYALT